MESITNKDHLSAGRTSLGMKHALRSQRLQGSNEIRKSLLYTTPI